MDVDQTAATAAQYPIAAGPIGVLPRPAQLLSARRDPRLHHHLQAGPVGHNAAVVPSLAVAAPAQAAPPQPPVIPRTDTHLQPVVEDQEMEEEEEEAQPDTDSGSNGGRSARAAAGGSKAQSNRGRRAPPRRSQVVEPL
jgi:hypothetical protein